MGELRVGDELVLAGGGCARVVNLTAPRGPPEGAPCSLTTYNIEVERAHTYFVGQAGVWAHNSSQRSCERIADIVEFIRNRYPETREQPWEAFKRFLDYTDPIDNPRDRSIWGTVSNALNDASNEITRQSLEAAIRADGTADLGKMRSVRQINEMLNRKLDPQLERWIQDPDKPARWTGGLIQNHHGIVKADGGLDWHDLLGIPPSRVDDVPGMLLDSAIHGADDASLPDAQRFHQIFKSKVEQARQLGIDLQTRSEQAKNNILNLHQDAYNEWGEAIGWGPGVGDRARAVFKTWLVQHGYW
jgi:hypothetical protein